GVTRVVDASQSGHRPQTVSAGKPLQNTLGMFCPAQISMDLRFLQINVGLRAITRPNLGSLGHSNHTGSIVCRRAKSLLFLDVYGPDMDTRPDLHSVVTGVSLKLHGEIEGFSRRPERHHQCVSEGANFVTRILFDQLPSVAKMRMQHIV